VVDLNEARTLCSKSELNLVESSFAPQLETIAPASLKLKLDVVRNLHQKSTRMIRLLHSESRIATTRRKIELFAETIGRLQAALDNRENFKSVERPVIKHHDGKPVLEIPIPGPDTSERNVRQLEGLDRRILSARRSEQLNSKSRSTRAESHVGSIPRRQQGRRNSSKNH